MPAPFAGTIREILAQENETVSVGQTPAIMEPTGTRAPPPCGHAVRSGHEHTAAGARGGGPR
ncbi:hypothetical protein D5S19_18520 [Amycolatopsis panacis]|uniref:Lipoyl-binding domain-containing protein n=1 Tax=Amycolatopsis panacis TaxID=2340917 RepID=A0A419I293_9PSEU|nr:hypothetical protein D5S19_18520 [Amycolatopsis panacis]